MRTILAATTCLLLALALAAPTAGAAARAAPHAVLSGLLSAGSGADAFVCHTGVAPAGAELARRTATTWSFTFALASPCGALADTCLGEREGDVISGACANGARFTLVEHEVRTQRNGTLYGVTAYEVALSGTLPGGISLAAWGTLSGAALDPPLVRP